MEAAGVLSCAFGLGYLLQSSHLMLSSSLLPPLRAVVHSPQYLSLTTLLVGLSLWSTFTFISLLLLSNAACAVSVVLSTIFSQAARTAGDAFAAFAVRGEARTAIERNTLTLLVAARALLGVAVVVSTKSRFMPVCFATPRFSASLIAADAVDVAGLMVGLVWAWVRWRQSAENDRTRGRGVFIVIAGMVAWAATDFLFSTSTGTSIFVRLIPTVLAVAILLAFIRLFPNVLYAYSNGPGSYALRRVGSTGSDFPRNTGDLENIKPGLYVREPRPTAARTSSGLFRDIIGRPIIDMHSAANTSRNTQEAHPGTMLPWADAPIAAQKEFYSRRESVGQVLQQHTRSYSVASEPFKKLPPGGTHDRETAVFERDGVSEVSSPSRTTIQSFAAIGGMSMISEPSTAGMYQQQQQQYQQQQQVQEGPPAGAPRPRVSAVKRRNRAEDAAPSIRSPPATARSMAHSLADFDYARFSQNTFSTSDDTAATSHYSQSHAGGFALGPPPRGHRPVDNNTHVLLLNEIIYDDPGLVQSLAAASTSAARYSHSRSATGLQRRSPPGTGKPPLSPPREVEEASLYAVPPGTATPVVERKRSIRRQSVRALFPARESRHLLQRPKSSRVPLASPPPPPTHPLPAPPVPKTPTKYAPKTPPLPVASTPKLPPHPPPHRVPPSPAPTVAAVPERQESVETVDSPSTEIEDVYEIARTWVASVPRAEGPVLVNIRHSRQSSSGSIHGAKPGHRRDSSLISNADSGIGSDTNTIALRDIESEVAAVRRASKLDSIALAGSAALMIRSRMSTLSLLHDPVKGSGGVDIESDTESSGKSSNRRSTSTAATTETDPLAVLPADISFYSPTTDHDADDEHFSDCASDSLSEAEDEEEEDEEDIDLMMAATEQRISAKIRELTEAIPAAASPPPTPPIFARHFQLGDHIPAFHRSDQYGQRRKAPPPALHAELLQQYRRRVPTAPPPVPTVPAVPPPPQEAHRVSVQNLIQARLSTVINRATPAPRTAVEELMQALPTAMIGQQQQAGKEAPQRASVLHRNSLLERLEHEMGQQESAWRDMRATLMAKRDSLASDLDSADTLRSERLSQRRSLVARLTESVEKRRSSTEADRRLSMASRRASSPDRKVSFTDRRMSMADPGVSADRILSYSTAQTTGTSTTAASAGAWQAQLAQAQMAYAQAVPQLDEKLRGWAWAWPGSRPVSVVVEPEVEVEPLPPSVFGGEHVLSPVAMSLVVLSPKEAAQNRRVSTGTFLCSPAETLSEASLWKPETRLSPAPSHGGLLWNGTPAYSTGIAAIATRPRRRFDAGPTPLLTSHNLWVPKRASASAVERSGLWRNPRDFQPRSIMSSHRRTPSIKRVTFVEEVVIVEPTGILGRLKKLWGRPQQPVSAVHRMVPVAVLPAPSLPAPPLPTLPVPPKTDEERIADVATVLSKITHKYQHKALPQVPAKDVLTRRSVLAPLPAPEPLSVIAPPVVSEKLWIAQQRMPPPSSTRTALWPVAPALPSAPLACVTRSSSACRDGDLRIESVGLWKSLSNKRGLWSPPPVRERLWTARRTLPSPKATLLWPAAAALSPVPLAPAARPPRPHCEPLQISSVRLWKPATKKPELWSPPAVREELWTTRRTFPSPRKTLLWPAAVPLSYSPPPPVARPSRAQQADLCISSVELWKPSTEKRVLWTPPPVREMLWTSRRTFPNPKKTVLWPAAPALPSPPLSPVARPFRSQCGDLQISSVELWKPSAGIKQRSEPRGLWESSVSLPKVQKLWTAPRGTPPSPRTTSLWPAAASLPSTPLAPLARPSRSYDDLSISSTELWKSSARTEAHTETSGLWSPPVSPKLWAAPCPPPPPTKTLLWPAGPTLASVPQKSVAERACRSRHRAPLCISSTELWQAAAGRSEKRGLWSPWSGCSGASTTRGLWPHGALQTRAADGLWCMPLHARPTPRRNLVLTLAPSVPIRAARDPRSSSAAPPTASGALWTAALDETPQPATVALWQAPAPARVAATRRAHVARTGGGAIAPAGAGLAGARTTPAAALWTQDAPACHCQLEPAPAPPALWVRPAPAPDRLPIAVSTRPLPSRAFSLAPAPKRRHRRRRSLPPSSSASLPSSPSSSSLPLSSVPADCESSMDGCSLWRRDSPALASPLRWGRPSARVGLWAAENSPVRPLCNVLAASGAHGADAQLWGRNSAPAVFATLPLESLRSHRDTSSATLPAVSEGLWKAHILEEEVVEPQSAPLWAPSSTRRRSAVMWNKEAAAAAASTDRFAHMPNDTARSKKVPSTEALPVFSEDMWKQRVVLPPRPRLWVAATKATGMWDAEGRTLDLARIRPVKRQKALWSEKTASRTTAAEAERTRCVFRPSSEPLAVVGGSLWASPATKAQNGLWKRPAPVRPAAAATPRKAPLWSRDTAHRTTAATPERSAVKKPLPPSVHLKPATGPMWTASRSAAAPAPTLWKRPLRTVAPGPVDLSGPRTPLWNRARASSRTTTAVPIRSAVQKRIPPPSATDEPLPKATGKLWSKPTPPESTGLWKRPAPVAPRRTRPRRSSTLWDRADAARTTTATPERSNPAPRKPTALPLKPATGGMWTPREAQKEAPTPPPSANGLWAAASKLQSIQQKVPVQMAVAVYPPMPLQSGASTPEISPRTLAPAY